MREAALTVLILCLSLTAPLLINPPHHKTTMADGLVHSAKRTVDLVFVVSLSTIYKTGDLFLHSTGADNLKGYRKFFASWKHFPSHRFHELDPPRRCCLIYQGAKCSMSRQFTTTTFLDRTSLCSMGWPQSSSDPPALAS